MDMRPKQLAQEGANLNDALVWDGSKWSPNNIGASYLKLDQTTPQSVVNGTPKFVDLELSGSEIGTPTYKTVSDFLNLMSSGRISGGLITDDGVGGVNISAISGIIKTSDSVNAASKFFDLVGGNIPSGSLTDNSVNWIYVDYNGGAIQFAASASRTSIKLTNQFIVGRIYKSGTDIEIAQTGEYLPNMLRADIDRLAYRGLQWADGGRFAETGVRYLTVTAGTFFLGLTKFITGAKNTSTGDTFSVFYKNGIGGFTEATGQTQVNNSNYDDGDGTLGSLTSNRYNVFWAYICNEGDIYLLYHNEASPPAGGYTLAQAQTVSLPATIPNYLSNFTKLAAKIIVQQGTANIVSIQSAFDTQFQLSSVQNHNDLSGLQGGTTDQYYHFTSAEHSTLQSIIGGVFTTQVNVTASASPVILGVRTSTETNTAQSVFRIRHATTNDAADGFGALLTFAFTDSGATDLVLGQFGAVRDTADTEGALIFRCGTNGIEDFMRLTKSGNLLIGTTTANQKVTLKGGNSFVVGTAFADLQSDDGYYLGDTNRGMSWNLFNVGLIGYLGYGVAIRTKADTGKSSAYWYLYKGNLSADFSANIQTIIFDPNCNSYNISGTLLRLYRAPTNVGATDTLSFLVWENASGVLGSIDKTGAISTFGQTLTFSSTSGTTTIKTGDVAGVARAIHFDIPVIVGGGADAALDYQFKLDGTLEAGLMAETDGAGSYRGAVWKNPYKTGAFGAAWASLTLPNLPVAPNGGHFTAYNSDTLKTREYVYSNGAWTYQEIGTALALPINYVDDLTFAYATAATVTISAGKCRDSGDTTDIVVGSPLTADITASGANGLDTGSEASSTWYSAWVIQKADGTVASLLSTSATSPTMPSGYTLKRRIGWVRNDASSNFLPFVCSGSGRTRQYLYNQTDKSSVAGTGLCVGYDLNQTSWTDLSLADLVPSTSILAHLAVEMDSTTAPGLIEFRTNGVTISDGESPFYVSQPDNDASTNTCLCVISDTSQIIEYRVSAASTPKGRVWVIGWQEDI